MASDFSAMASDFSAMASDFSPIQICLDIYGEDVYSRDWNTSIFNN
jgi:hypothetical protein